MDTHIKITAFLKAIKLYLILDYGIKRSAAFAFDNPHYSTFDVFFSNKF